MMDYVIKVTTATVIVFILLQPEAVGIWEAKKDIAYEIYMGEHYNDN